MNRELRFRRRRLDSSHTVLSVLPRSLVLSSSAGDGSIGRLLRVILLAICPSQFDAICIGRLLLAALVGMSLGLERRSSHRATGVRTMGLVAIGAALFGIVSQYGFTHGDPSRVAASICSGVGFIGAGVITTSHQMNWDIGDAIQRSTQQEYAKVRGLTTAASIWVCAGLGLASGVGLYCLSIVGGVLVMFVLEYQRVRRKASSVINQFKTVFGGKTDIDEEAWREMEVEDKLEGRGAN